MEHAGRQAPAERRADITGPVEFVMQPGCAEGLRVGGQFVAAFRTFREPLERRLRSQHPGLHGAVAALDAGHVQESGLATDHRAAGKDQLRQRLQAALVHRPRPEATRCPPSKNGRIFGMGLVALELVERAEPGIAVVERNDEPDRHLPAGQMVEKDPP